MTGRHEQRQVFVLGDAPAPAVVADFGQYAQPATSSMTSMTSSTGSAAGSVSAAHTEVIMIPPAVPDPVPDVLVDLGEIRPVRTDAAGPAARRAASPSSWPRTLVSAAALAVFGVAMFVGGQWSADRGVGPVVQLPVAQVETAVQTARLWRLASPEERKQQCRWLAAPGDSRDYTLRAWQGHLRADAGGAVQEVDPASVARVLDDACAGRRP